MDTIKLDMILKMVDEKEMLEIMVEKTKYTIDFTSSDQSKLREMFLAVLEIMTEKNKCVEFDYQKDAGFNNELYENVASEYVAGLNSELKTIFQHMSNPNIE